MKPFSITLVFYFLSLFASSQYYETPEEESTPLLTITDINISGGSWTVRPMSEGRDDFESLAPNSNLLSMNLDGFSFTPNDNFVSNAAANLSLGFNIRSNWKEKFGQRVRIGFSSSNSTLFSGLYSKRDRFPYDTLTSSSSGTIQVLDSIRSQNLILTYQNRSILIEATYLAVLNPMNRWSFYTGLGIGVGWTVNAETNLEYTVNWNTESTSSGNFTSFNNSTRNLVQTEFFRNKRSFAMTTSLPIGVNFRIGKKRQFWLPFQLFYEIQPTVRINDIPEVGVITHLPVIQNFGLRVTI